MHGAAKSVGENFQSIARYCSSNGSCMGGQPARGLLHSGSADTVVVDLFGRTGNTGAARRGIELRGFHGWRQTGRQPRVGRREREIERGRRMRRDAARGRTETRMRSGEGRLRDEDMHINRETSTEMSDHRE